MINSIRNTVLFLLNKDNRGYISPLEYNHYCKMAQLEIFEGYFTEKIFQSFEGGCIPVYWAVGRPEPDIINED